MGKSAVTNKNELVKAEIAPISELHEMARGYARDGIKIFPCIPDGKAPAIAGGFTKATCNLAQIDKWWGENENFNIALALNILGDELIVGGFPWTAGLPSLSHATNSASIMADLHALKSSEPTPS